MLCAMLAACGGGGGSSSAGSDTGGGNLAPVSGAAPAGSGDQQQQQQQADATLARFNQPFGLAMDAAGNMYVADSGNFTVRKIGSDGSVLTLAGAPGLSGYSDGTGAAARFSSISGIAVDGAGNVYVVDNNAVRKITAAGVVTTLAGVPGARGDSDGTGSAALFNQPLGIAAAADGTVYVADYGNYLVRAVSPAGVVTTVAGVRGGRGRIDGSTASASFLGPQGIALDGSGNLYVTDWFGPPAPNIPEGSTLVRRIAGGSVTTIAGTIRGETGPAQFVDTFAIAADAGGNVYVAAQNSVQRIAPTGAVSTVTAAATAFQSLEGLAIDAAGNLYVADRPSHAISRITQAGAVTVYAGQPGTSGNLDTP